MTGVNSLAAYCPYFIDQTREAPVTYLLRSLIDQTFTKETKMAIKKRAPFFPRNKNGATVPNLPNALNPAFYR